MLFAFGGASTQAQPIPTFCGELSESDCTILTESQSAMSALESTALQYQIDMTLSGIPDMPDDATFSLFGDARYAITDPEVLQNISATMTDDMAAALESLFKAFALDTTAILRLPENLPGSTDGDKGSFSLRLVDGFAYINIDKMADLFGGSAAQMGWQGIDLAGFYGMMFRQFEQQGGFNMDMLQDPQAALEMMEDFVAIERVDNTNVAGQSMAVFHYTYDYGALASESFLMDMMRAQFESMNAFPGMDVDTIMDFYSAVLSAIQLETTQAIGLDDHYIHNFGLRMDWALDMEELASMMGESSAGMPSINIVIEANVDLNQFNDIAPI
jgi:hypothetical protein